jgi:hypothetical protein
MTGLRQCAGMTPEQRAIPWTSVRSSSAASSPCGLCRAVVARGSKTSLSPGTDRSRVGEIRINGETSSVSLPQKVVGEGARSIRTEAASTRCRNEEHVESGVSRPVSEPHLEVPDRSASRLDDVRIDVPAAKSRSHLFVCERFVVPVAGDLRIPMPTDEEVCIGAGRRTHGGQLAEDPTRRDSHNSSRGG